MPIRPENRHRYPKEWPAIRRRILERAGHKCEWCHVPNHALIQRRGEAWTQLGPTEAEVAALDGERVVRVVLTIAHVHDMSPENCADDNLAALCQRCHNRHDAKHRQRTRTETRLRRDAEQGQALIWRANG